MKPLVIAIACFFTVKVSARSVQDSIPTNASNVLAQNYRPAFRITAKEIENLPFISLMEVINGAFPFVFADPPTTTEYNFLYDGKLLVNVNAINISQIAQIEYYPVAFNIANGSLSGKGTFVITSKHAASPGYGLQIRSQGGIIMPTKSSFGINVPDRFKSNDKNEYFTHQEIGYGYSRKKLSISSALAFTRTGIPDYNYTVGQGREDYTDAFKRLRFSTDVAYQLSRKLTLTGAVFAYQHKTEHTRDVVFTGFPSSSYVESARKPFYWSAHAGLTFRPAANITNTLQLEFSEIKGDSTADITNRLPPQRTRYLNYTQKPENRSYAITNSTKGAFNAGGNVTLGWELLLRYYELKLHSRFDEISREENGPVLGIAFGSQKSVARSVAIMPRLSAGFNNQFFITAGLTYDDWKNTASFANDTNSKNQLFPYAGMRWTMPQPAGVLSSLNIHTTYGKSWQLPATADLLDIYAPRETSFGFFMADSEKFPAENWISGADIGLANNRFIFSVNYITGKLYPLLKRPLQSPFFDLVFFRETKHHGLSAGVDARVVENQIFGVRLKGMMFYDRYELDDTTGQAFLQQYNPVLNKDGEWRGTIQLMANAGNIFLQASGMLRFKSQNVAFMPGRGFSTDETSNHSLNFLLAGYRIQFRKSKHIDISLQARNIITPKQTPAAFYYGSKYYGLGVKAML